LLKNGRKQHPEGGKSQSDNRMGTAPKMNDLASEALKL
jgi:hypothetical protein